MAAVGVSENTCRLIRRDRGRWNVVGARRQEAYWFGDHDLRVKEWLRARARRSESLLLAATTQINLEKEIAFETTEAEEGLKLVELLVLFGCVEMMRDEFKEMTRFELSHLVWERSTFGNRGICTAELAIKCINNAWVDRRFDDGILEILARRLVSMIARVEMAELLLSIPFYAQPAEYKGSTIYSQIMDIPEGEPRSRVLCQFLVSHPECHADLLNRLFLLPEAWEICARLSPQVVETVAWTTYQRGSDSSGFFLHNQCMLIELGPWIHFFKDKEKTHLQLDSIQKSILLYNKRRTLVFQQLSTLVAHRLPPCLIHLVIDYMPLVVFPVLKS